MITPPVEPAAEPLHTCANCRTEIDYDDAACHDGSSYCQTCYDELYTLCSDCNDTISRNNTYRDDNGDTFCENCYCERYTSCNNCDCETLRDEADDNGNCPDCQETANVHNYNYTPNLNFLRLCTDTAAPLYMGVELEVESNGNDKANAAECLTDTTGDIYLKTDGSLDDGFEIITHPATLAYHQSALPWDKITSSLTRRGFTSFNTTTCGLHVHASINYMSESERVKLGMFIHIQQSRVEKIAQRSNAHYAKFHAKKIKDMTKNCEGRYEALNWQNTDTVEFRVFKGTLKLETILAYIEFVHASIHFVKTVSSPSLTDKDKSWKSFVAYVSANTSTYKQLPLYLAHKGLSDKPATATATEKGEQ